MAYEQLTLHIGLPKTGTTTIQSFLEMNRRCLRKQRIAYAGPRTLKSYPQKSDFWKEDHLRRGLDELNRLAREARARRVLWSNEWLSTYAFGLDGTFPRLIRQEVPASNYRVVVYLRRQDHRIGSMYLQAGIRSKEYPGPVRNFDDWARLAFGDNFQNLLPASMDYAGLIQQWSGVFGSENIVVRVMEKRQLFNNDLLQDFCKVVEIPTTDCVFNVADKNVSYNMELHDLLGRYNSAFADSTFSGKMIQFMDANGGDDFFSRPCFSRFAISPKRRIEILQHCEESNRKIAKDYLKREDGVLFREPWPSPDDPHQPYEGLTPEKTTLIFLHLLQTQHERIRRLERRLDILDTVRNILRMPGKLKEGFKKLVTFGTNGSGKEAAKK